MLTSQIQSLCAEASADPRENWDFDIGMPLDRAQQSSLGRLVLALLKNSPTAVDWLTYFAARRADDQVLLDQKIVEFRDRMSPSERADFAQRFSQTVSYLEYRVPVT